MAISSRSKTQSLLSRIAGAIAIVSSLVISILVVSLAASLASRRKPYALATVAGISQFLSFFALGYLYFCQYRQEKNRALHHELQRKRQGSLIIFVLCAVLSAYASALVAAVLGQAIASFARSTLRVLGQTVTVFVDIAFVVWGIAILSQFVFYICLGLAGRSGPENLPEPLSSMQEVPSRTVDDSRPTISTTIEANPFREPTYSAPPSDGTSSLRSSISTVQRPTSKSRLVHRQHSFPRHSKNSSSDSPSSQRVSQDEGFDSWDTSSVGSHIRETVLMSSPSTMRVPILEPIPGSRSPSPAKALEGPFFQQSPPSSPPPSPLPQPGFSQPQRSSSEDHIHPLFRTCSPTPPPTASSGTVVTAAPGAGLIINQRMLHRMRSGSLPSSPSPLMRSESFDHFIAIRTPTSPNLERNARPSTSPKEKTALVRSGSFDDFIATRSPATPLQRLGRHSASPRSYTAPTRASTIRTPTSPISLASPTSPTSPTQGISPQHSPPLSQDPVPPIPDFILSAGSRTSLITYGKRSASCHSSPDG